jgi:hypothetical protein
LGLPKRCDFLVNVKIHPVMFNGPMAVFPMEQPIFGVGVIITGKADGTDICQNQIAPMADIGNV